MIRLDDLEDSRNNHFNFSCPLRRISGVSARFFFEMISSLRLRSKRSSFFQRACLSLRFLARSEFFRWADFSRSARLLARLLSRLVRIARLRERAAAAALRAMGISI
jgi:hypothetical protein